MSYSIVIDSMSKPSSSAIGKSGQGEELSLKKGKALGGGAMKGNKISFSLMMPTG